MVLHKLHCLTHKTLFLVFSLPLFPAKSGREAAPSAVLFSRPLVWNWGPQTTAFRGFWFAVAALVASTLRVHSVIQAIEKLSGARRKQGEE
ncbi:hypothetical protein LGV61_12320 [Desulfurispirillum indicum]|uniref:hypothetical protein n=1 Tax=Desulfurispirillum indicum TaxID=936456 RepID=UPI001CF94F14|nr:hypothetical protein [Desulfurispirillum indicum]UCZ56498.1 hypothetical protein LGV61_12320 [Desulfurispirillum indicum]